MHIYIIQTSIPCLRHGVSHKFTLDVNKQKVCQVFYNNNSLTSATYHASAIIQTVIGINMFFKYNCRAFISLLFDVGIITVFFNVSTFTSIFRNMSFVIIIGLLFTVYRLVLL